MLQAISRPAGAEDRLNQAQLTQRPVARDADFSGLLARFAREEGCSGVTNGTILDPKM
jgi:hypothetical protein